MSKLPILRWLKNRCQLKQPKALKQWLPIDYSGVSAVVFLGVAVTGLLLVGDRRLPEVQSFSWAEQTIGVEDEAFMLTFDQPMNWESVIENLEIEPPIAGKFSWTDQQQLAYTFTDLPEYGTRYTVRLPDAETQPLSSRQAAQPLPTFESEFQVRDRAFAYIGVKGEEQGRLILYNITTGKRLPLTPPDLVVSNFQPSADGQAIFFLAFAANQIEGVSQQQLYRVTTGRPIRGEEPEIPGLLERLLDADRYENRQFVIAAAADTLVVERLNRQNPSDRGLWLVSAKGDIRALGRQSEDFQLSPDGQTLAIRQPAGLTLLPLTPEADPQVVFPDYEALLAFSPQDQRRRVLVRRNRDLTRSLVLQTAEGQEREILQTSGFILSCTFEPRQESFLYCIQAEALDTEQTQVKPFLTLVNLKTRKVVPLVALTDDLNVRMNLAADGRTLLFDQVVADTQPNTSINPIPQGSLWLLNLPDFTQQRRTHALDTPQNITAGLDPQWLP